jgi:NAD(P)H dehydrogenase (quinone)
MRIVVTGASGHLGRGVADRLLEQVDPADLILVTRDPQALAGYAERGVAVRRGDFDDPDGLRGTFAGGDRALIISTAVAGPHRIRQHADAIDAAKAAGVGHVAYTSLVRAEPGNPAGVVPDHYATEAHLRASGLDWTLLRNSVYADLEAFSMPAAVATGRLVSNSGEGRIGYVARADCAAAAAAVLAGDGHESRTYDITGPAALSGADRAAVFAELTGKPVAVVDVGDEAFADALVEHGGMARQGAELLASFGRAAREGWLDAESGDVEALTGRPPQALRSVLETAG